MQNAGPKLADPGWRMRPDAMVSFGHSSGSCHEAAAPGTPNGQMPNGSGTAAAVPNGSGAFRFGVPGSEYLSFAGPGGDAFAAGALLLLPLPLLLLLELHCSRSS